MQIIINFNKEQIYEIIYSFIKEIIDNEGYIHPENVLNYTKNNTFIDNVIYSILNNNVIKCTCDGATFNITYSQIKQYLKESIEENSYLDNYYIASNILYKFVKTAEDESNN